MSELTPDGYRLRERLAEIGHEFTPDEMVESIEEADERIRPGPGGLCIRCGHDDSDGRDFRYGLCDRCAFPDREKNDE